MLQKLQKVHCDPDVALRLAFFVASRKPVSKSELSGDNERHQRVKRKLSQARNHLLTAARAFIDLGLPEIAKGKKRPKQHRLTQSHSHVQKAEVELQRAMLEMPLIFIQQEDINALKTKADLTTLGKLGALKYLQKLASMCDYEMETLLWPRVLELPPHYELVMLVSYIKNCSGKAHYSLVADLLAEADGACDLVRSVIGNPTEPLTENAIDKRIGQVKEFYSFGPEQIEHHMARWANSGDMRRDLLTLYPD